MLPSPFNDPTLRPDLPLYPQVMQLLRVGTGTIPGPGGYASSSAGAGGAGTGDGAPSLYLAATCQLRTDTLLPRDREPCLADDVNRVGLTPGWYLGRLAGSFNGLPVYEVACCGGAGALPGLSSGQLDYLTAVLTPAQIAVLNNLNACQLQTFLTLGTPQIQTLTSVLTPTQLTYLVDSLTSSQLTNMVATLPTADLQKLTSSLVGNQVQQLVQSFTAAQIKTLVEGLTTAQLQHLTMYDPATTTVLVNTMLTPDLATFLTNAPTTGSVLTTKGDLLAYGVRDTRLPIGSSGQVLTANPAVALGLDWETPSGGGATGGTVTIAKLSSNFTTTSGSFVDVTGLSFSAAINTDYSFEFTVVFSVGTNGDNISFSLNGPSSPTELTYWQLADTSLSNSVQTAYDTATGFVVAITARHVMFVKGVLRNGANAGTVALRLRRNSGTGTETVYQGSTLVVNKGT